MGICPDRPLTEARSFSHLFGYLFFLHIFYKSLYLFSQQIIFKEKLPDFQAVYLYVTLRRETMKTLQRLCIILFCVLITTQAQAADITVDENYRR